MMRLTMLQYVALACCDRLAGASGIKKAVLEAPAKRSQHANATTRNMLRAFGHPIATCCDVLGVVGSNLTIFKLEPITTNMSQHGGQTQATCCAQQWQQCLDMLR